MTSVETPADVPFAQQDDGLTYIDADGHIVEPPFGLQDYATAEFRDRIYHVEIDDEEMFEARTDPGGIFYFPGVRGNVFIRLTPVSTISPGSRCGSS